MVTVHTWGNTRAWERGRPALVASPRVRCPRFQEKCEHLLSMLLVDGASKHASHHRQLDEECLAPFFNVTLIAS
jgi:hypothetical protein